MDIGSVGAASGLGLAVLLGVVLCIYGKCTERPRELLPLYHRSHIRTLFPAAP